MELPKLGTQCSFDFCRQLDFLPIKCDACEKQFCKDHMRYEDHKCESSYKKNVQVPVCPLCDKPVPVPRGELADIKVGEHIDRDCQSDPAKKKRQAYTNRCSAPKCKQKELMPVLCSDCRLNYCLRHRHPQDHDCRGFQGSGHSISNAGAAAVSRYNKASSSSKSNKAASISNAPQRSTLNQLGRNLNSERQGRQASAQDLQGNLTEDEALAKALQISLSSGAELTQEEKDLMMAQQLQEEENEIRRRQQRTNQSRDQRQSDTSCVMS